MNTHELVDFYCDDTERGREIADDITAAYAEGYEQGKRDAVVHGRWGPAYYTDDGLLLRDCEKCGRAHTALSDFCPNCGAQMDGKAGSNGHKRRD